MSTLDNEEMFQQVNRLSSGHNALRNMRRLRKHRTIDRLTINIMTLLIFCLGAGATIALPPGINRFIVQLCFLFMLLACRHMRGTSDYFWQNMLDEYSKI